MKTTDRDWRREPLRALLELRPGRALQAVLLALFCLVFFALVRSACAEMEGETVIAALAALCAAILIAGSWRQLSGQRLMVLLCAALAILLALGAHLSLLSIRPGRMSRVLTPLLNDLWNYDLPVAMAWEEGSWSAGYLIVMALFSRLEGFSALYAVKLLDLFCLSLAALGVSHMAKQRGAGPEGIILSLTASLALPTMLFNSGLWAQCDAVFAAFTIWGLALLLEDRPLPGCLLWGAALAFKLQSAFLFPLLIPFFFRRKVGLRHIAALALAFLLPHVPMLLQGQELRAILGRYNDQILIESYGEIPTDDDEGEEEAWTEENWEETEETEGEPETEEETVYLHEGLASHAPSVYHLMTVASVREFSGMGLYLAIACALLVVFVLLRRPANTVDTWLTAALLLACGLPIILPQMNARCLYLAGLISLTRLNRPIRAAEAVLLELISLCSYMEAIFSTEAQLVSVLPMGVLSLLLIVCGLMTAAELYMDLTGRREERRVQDR